MLDIANFDDVIDRQANITQEVSFKNNGKHLNAFYVIYKKIVFIINVRLIALCCCCCCLALASDFTNM